MFVSEMYTFGLHDVILFTVSIVFITIHWNDKKPIDCLVVDSENYHHHLNKTIANLCSICSNVLVVSGAFVYPQVEPLHNVSDCLGTTITIFEQDKLDKSLYEVGNLISAFKYLLVIPEGVQIDLNANEQSVYSFIDLLEDLDDNNALLFPVQGECSVEAHRFHFDRKRWTLLLDDKNVNTLSSEYYSTNQLVLLIEGTSLLRLPRPFERPFFKSFFIQSQLVNIHYRMIEDVSVFHTKVDDHVDDRLRQKLQIYEQHRLERLYHRLGVKLQIEANGTRRYYGCDRDKPRCFGTIINEMPDFLAVDRWLPPCCRRNLEETGRYVFDILTKFGVRYWLEGGSLLGAARNGQIIDWDYDIDLGFYREDSNKFTLLEQLLNSPGGYQIKDGAGYVWEKAIEGDFIKVHYSHINRIHVDLFPFHSLNGTMTKNTWFASHRQDCPFPEHYLKPMNRASFIGVTVSVPNNMRDFLEFKFGKGVIEQARYPNGQKV